MEQENTELITISFKVPTPKKEAEKRELTGKIALFCRFLTGKLQKDFALDVKIGKNRLYKIETGKIEATHEEIKAIANISGQSLDVFNY